MEDDALMAGLRRMQAHLTQHGLENLSGFTELAQVIAELFIKNRQDTIGLEADIEDERKLDGDGPSLEDFSDRTAIHLLRKLNSRAAVHMRHGSEENYTMPEAQQTLQLTMLINLSKLKEMGLTLTPAEEEQLKDLVEDQVAGASASAIASWRDISDTLALFAIRIMENRGLAPQQPEAVDPASTNLTVEATYCLLPDANDTGLVGACPIQQHPDAER